MGHPREDPGHPEQDAGPPRGRGLLRFLTSRCQLPPGDVRPTLAPFHFCLCTVAHASDAAAASPGEGGVTVPRGSRVTR